MESQITLSPADEKELLELFLDNPELGKQRILFQPYLGNPIWWIAYPKSCKTKTTLVIHAKTHQLWSDPRLEKLTCNQSMLRQSGRKFRHGTPFQVNCKHNLLIHCIPLMANGKHLGVLGISHLRLSYIKRSMLNLASSVIQTLMTKTLREYELKRLSDSIRPRAIALSTVHTVHRLINATLNLDELVSHLARLTSQVLRSKTCAIFLNDPSRKRFQTLLERAKVGFPQKTLKRFRSFKPGEGIEGRVFSTAKFVLRKTLICVPLVDQDVIGVITLTHKKDGSSFTVFDREILMTLAEEAVVAIKNAQLYEEQKKVTLGAIRSMSAILDAQFGHAGRLNRDTLIDISLSMADMLKATEEEKLAIHYATILKDAAKVGLPEEIVKKPTKLTGEEYRILREHPIKGAKIIQSFESLKPVSPIILYSHEHYDGSGYPQGLKGNEIPLGARILALVNALDALLAGRPYKSRSTLKETVCELKSHRGTQFDPKVVDAFEHLAAKPKIAKLLSNGAL